MSRWLRSAGAAGLLALVLLGVPGARPAMAAPPTVSLDNPGADSIKDAAFAITGSARQDGNEAAIASIKVKLTDDEGWVPPIEHNYSQGGNNSAIFSGSGANVSFNWANVVPKYNGPHTVTVSVTGQYRTLSGLQSASSSVSKSFHVEIAPANATGVTAELNDETGAVAVKWKANPEPDIAGYGVFRSYAGGTAKNVSGDLLVDGLSFTDTLAGGAPGQYRYAVLAVRHARSCKSASNTDEACGRGIAAKGYSTYSTAVTVRATAPTTTTTTIKKGGNNGGSSGGGSNGGTSGGGSTGGGSTSGGRTTGRGGSTGGSGFAPGGNVDLSEFSNLLNPQAGRTPTRPGEPEGTYDGALPYGERSPEETEDDSLITIGGTSLPKPSDDWVKFIGAGSLATALLVHVLWFKQQVDAVPLETLSE